VAGNICDTNTFATNQHVTDHMVRDVFVEQVALAGVAAVDLVVAETLSYAPEDLLAFDVIQPLTGYRSNTGARRR
jgi:hypothetical protein